MKTLFTKCGFAALTLLSFGLPAFADKIYIESPKETPPELDAKSLQGLVRSSISGAGHQPVDTAAEADFSVRPSLIKLGTAYIVSLEKVTKGNTAIATKLKARELEEVDEVMQRVVRAALSGVDARTDARVSDVTIDETTQGTRRKQARAVKEALGGVAFLGHLGTSTPAYFVGYNSAWEIGPTLRIGFKWDFALSIQPDSAPAAMFSDFLLNVAYYPLDRDFSPFISGEYGFGFVRDAASRGLYGGMSVGGSAGVALFRTYSTHLEIGVRGAALLSTALPHTPLLGSLWLGVSF